jgi:hypothetical protein
VAVDALPRPPRGVTAIDFFRSYLPDLAAALAAGMPSLPTTFELGVRVGAQDLRVCIGPAGLTCEDGAPASPTLTCECEPDEVVRTARDLAPSILRLVDKALPRWRAGAKPTTPARLDLSRLAARPGRLELEVVDDAGDVFRAACRVGTGAGPRALIRLTDPELRRLFAGGTRLSSLLGSRIQVEGDLAWLLQLVGLLEHTTGS